MEGEDLERGVFMYAQLVITACPFSIWAVDLDI